VAVWESASLDLVKIQDLLAIAMSLNMNIAIECAGSMRNLIDVVHIYKSTQQQSNRKTE
jgi:hypothetical protein